MMEEEQQVAEHDDDNASASATTITDNGSSNSNSNNNSKKEQHDQVEERFDSSSPEMPVLSSSTSTSSISSTSSGESVGNDGGRNIRPKHGSIINGTINKSFYNLPLATQREDSGIFASDDTSTSEFSQSPSPDFLTNKNVEVFNYLIVFIIDLLKYFFLIVE